MDPSAARTGLRGQEIAITGRLASMTRTAAVGALERAGGRYATDVHSTTDLLVVGELGWPGRGDGHDTRSLRAARELAQNGATIAIVGEPEFLGRLGLGTASGPNGAQLFTINEVSRMLDVPVERLRAWIRADLLQPREAIGGLARFDFLQVARARTLHGLADSGASDTRIRRSLEQLERWRPAAEQSVAQLEADEARGPLQVRLEDGRRADASGQLHLDFQGERRQATGSGRLTRFTFSDLGDADTLFEVGLAAEAEGRLGDAEDAYRRALRAGERLAEIAFNLGNVLCARGAARDAASNYRLAVELEPSFVEAWNNLGNALSEAQRLPRAIAAYRRALQIDPGYADAHYNLAHTLELQGKRDSARPHWRAYLAADSDSPWAEEARKCLAGEQSGEG